MLDRSVRGTILLQDASDVNLEFEEATIESELQTSMAFVMI